MLKSYFKKNLKVENCKKSCEICKNETYKKSSKFAKNFFCFTLMIFSVTQISFAQKKSSGANSNVADSSKTSAKENSAKIDNSLQMNFIENLQSILEKTNGDLNAAIAAFDSIPEEIKNDKDLLLIKSSFLISASRVDEALKLILQLESENPNNIEILELKIIAYKARGSSAKNLQEKKSVITKVLELDPNNAVANVALGQENVLQKKYKNARVYFKKALVSSPRDFDAIFGVGQTSYYLRDFDDARLSFKKLLAINPQEAIAYQYLGKLEAEDENYKKAYEYILKAISFDSNISDFYMDLGTYARFLGKFGEAEKAWTKAIELNPNYFLAYAYRAGLYDEQNQFVKALEDYRKVVETNPSYYYAYESIGILAWGQKHYDEARAAFEKAFSYNKTNYSYPLMMGACLLKMNKSVEAKNVLQNAMKSKTDKKDLDFSMLRLFHDLGPSNAENDIALRIQREDNSTTRGKMLYYFGLFYEIKNNINLSKKYYGEVKNMQSPLFFEYRLAEWGLENEQN